MHCYFCYDLDVAKVKHVVKLEWRNAQKMIDGVYIYIKMAGHCNKW